MRLTVSIVALTVVLTACGNADVAQNAKEFGLNQINEMGSHLITNAIKNECQNQLDNQQGLVDLILTDKQKANICDCVADELQDNLTIDTLQDFIKDGKVDTHALTNAVTQVMTDCTMPQGTTFADNTERSS
ncbi:MAG: hypothetical protein Q3971_05630 [Moraxella sp.]|nr:hypothetical protein [Moraxella sp.]